MMCQLSLGGMQIEDEIRPINVDGHRLDLVLQDHSCDHSSDQGRRIQSLETAETVDETRLMQTTADLLIRDLPADLDTILRVLRKSFHTLQPGQTFTVQVVSGDVIRDVLARCERNSIADEREFRQWLEPLLSPSCTRFSRKSEIGAGSPSFDSCKARPASTNPRLRAFSPLCPPEWAATALSFVKEVDIISTRRQEALPSKKTQKQGEEADNPKKKPQRYPKKPKQGGE